MKQRQMLVDTNSQKHVFHSLFQIAGGSFCMLNQWTSISHMNNDESF